MLSTMQNFNADELKQLLADTLSNKNELSVLEGYLTDRGVLEDARLNQALMETFARLAATTVKQPDAPVVALEKILDRWAALADSITPGNVLAIFPATAALSYAQVALAQPDWLSDELDKLQKLASCSSLTVREVLIEALHNLVEATSDEADKTRNILNEWTQQDNTAVQEVAKAALA